MTLAADAFFIVHCVSPRTYDNEENNDRGHVLTSATECRDDRKLEVMNLNGSLPLYQSYTWHTKQGH